MSFKDRLRAGAILRGVVSVIPSAVVAEAVASAGADFVMIDREHGPISRETMHAMIAATNGTSCAPLVRVPGIEEAEVKIALDSGAEGIVYPLVRTVGDAERCVSLLTYPPVGRRGWGPFVAHSRYGTPLLDYAASVGDRIVCCLLIETVEAVENIESILAVPEIDFIVMAQFDLSSALGVLGQFNSAPMLEAVQTIERAAKARGVPLGAAALTAEQSHVMEARGYQVLINGVDALTLKTQVSELMRW
ncbi:MAG TPA: aldolase/citrate lyase family protein [Solirubrobacteraceae bacterium]|jgi:4-hydroxy-2-oxoheptanedioate aldolase|nr:aldolase/citrate lyase family protein [Solirubrobacteraceae bacterium]